MKRGAALLSLSVAISSPGTARGACPTPITPGELGETLDRAEAMLEALDEKFFELMESNGDRLRCLDQALSRDEAARVHRMVGLVEHYEDRERAAQAFAAARYLEGTYSFPEALLGPNAPERETYSLLSMDSRRVEPAANPATGQIVFDGRPSLERVTSWPTIFQFKGSDGVIDTAYLWPGDPTPDYPEQQITQEVQASPPLPVVDEVPAQVVDRWAKPLTVGGASALGVGAGLSLIGVALYSAGDIRQRDDQAARDYYFGTLVPMWIGGGVMVVGGGASLTWGRVRARRER